MVVTESPVQDRVGAHGLSWSVCASLQCHGLCAGESWAGQLVCNRAQLLVVPSVELSLPVLSQLDISAAVVKCCTERLVL